MGKALTNKKDAYIKKKKKKKNITEEGKKERRQYAHLLFTTPI